MAEDNQKKRKLSENEDEEDEEPQPSKSVKVMTATKLREKMKTSEGLTAVKLYFTSEADQDLVGQYIEEGGSVPELVSLLSNIDFKKNMSHAVIVFLAIHRVVMKIISSFPDRFDELGKVCKEFTGTYLTTLLNVVKDTSSPVSQKRTVLKLLTAIVSVNETLAREVLTELDLGQDELAVLTKHFKPNDHNSLRVAYINFLLAFIIERPFNLVQKLIYKKGLLICIFQGLKYDDFITAEMLLSCLLTHIVRTKEITKTQRLLLFNSHVLLHLVNVYNWNPYALIEEDKNKKDLLVKEPSLDQKETIREGVHSLLMTLCTSHKIGMVFLDPSYGTSGKHHNHIMYTLLEGMGQLWEDPLKEELSIAILQHCPDLLKPVFPLFSSYLESESKFVKVARFFTQVIEKIEIETKTLEAKYCLKVAKDLCVPGAMMRAVSRREFLVNRDAEVRMTAVEALVTALSKLSQLTKSAASLLDADFNTSISLYLISCLSDGLVLLDCLTVWKDDKDSGERETGLYKTISALLLYNAVCPQLLDPLRYNEDQFVKIRECVKEMTESCNINEELCSSIAVKAIQLGLIVNPQDPTKDEFREEIGELCRLVGEGNCKGGVEVLGEVLGGTGYLEGCAHELPVWLHVLEEHPGGSGLFPEALAYASSQSMPLVRMTMRAEEATSTLQEDDLALALDLDHLIGLAEEDKGDLVGVSLYTGLNVSLILPAVLKVMDGETDTDDEKISYVAKVLVHLFHYQVSPQAFVSLLRNFRSKAVTMVLPYMETWDQSASILNVPPFLDTPHHYISQYLLSEGFMDKPLEKVDVEDAVSVELCFRHCIFVLCQLSNIGMVTDAVITKALPLLEELVRSHKLVNPTILGHPQLLRDFHPVRKSSNLTKLVLCLTSNLEIPDKALVPYSHRLVFDLKYALSKGSVLKCKDLQLILETFPINKEDTKMLLLQVMRLDMDQLVGKRSATGWVKLEAHLLKKAVEYKIILENEDLTVLCRQAANLCGHKANIEEFLDALWKYLEIYTSPDFYGDVIASFEKLLRGLWKGESWSDGLARWLLSSVGRCGSEMWSTLAVQRAAPLFSLLPPHKALHLLDLHTTHIVHALTSDPTPTWLSHISLLVPSSMRVENCEKICRQIQKKEEEVTPTKENLELLLAIFRKASLSMTLSNLMHSWLLRSLKQEDQSKSEELCRVMVECMDDIDNDDGPQKCSAELIKLLISKGLKNSVAIYLKLLKEYVKFEATELTFEMIFQFVTSHSCFLSVILTSHLVKYELLCLLTELVKKDESIMRSAHIPVYLSAYNATLSRNDQTILQLLQLYEKKGGSMSDWKPVMWGEAAVDHYSLRDKPTLNKASSFRTLQLLNLKTVHTTISNFPIRRGLEDEDLVDEEEGIYDPAFLLPLMSQMLAPGSEVGGGREVAMNGVLALALSSLASTQPKIRLVGYHILQRHLSSLTETKDNLIWTHFIEAVQSGLGALEGEEGNLKLSSIATVFLARTSLIMTEPPHIMYKPLYNFVLAKPTFNLNSVPAFFELFNSVDIKHSVHQEWMLEVLRDGLREPTDLQLALNSYVFKFILDYHSCSLATQQIKKIIEDIVEKCLVSVDSKKHLLVNEYSVLSWISHGVESPKMIEKIASKINAPYKPMVDHIRSKMEALTDDVDSISLS